MTVTLAEVGKVRAETEVEVPPREHGVPVTVAANQSVAASVSPLFCSWLLWVWSLGRAQLGCSHLKA